MANPIDIGLRIAQALDSIGIKMGSYIGKGSNVKKAMFGGKSTMFKPNAIQSLRGEGKNFEDALKLIEEESQFIVNATDAEKMAYLNNLNDYKDLGGPLKKDLVASKQFEEGIGSLKDDIKSLQSTAKTMKEDAEKGLKSAEDDLKTFLETGGNPLKKEDKKYLGGSMHEEGQLRTAIRTFLRNEFKNGKIKLDETDKFRVMEYSPMMEDDPIKVFKKIYGDEAYKRAGTFPGAFETGENFNHYESIFRSKMGEDILKVKDKKYVGDGTLVLTDEVKTPTPDDDVPFAKGGRAALSLGGPPKMVKGVMEIIKMIKTKMSPIGAMKEVNKVIGKKGDYSRLTQKDIDQIVEETHDHIFQRDPDNLYVGDRNIDETDNMSLEDSLTTMEGLGATQTAERFRLKQKYPGITDDLVDKILIDDNPQRKAELLGTLDEAFRMLEKGKGEDEIIEIFKNTTRTKNAKGGRAGYYSGGQAMIEPDLSDVGHGSDALMARTRLTAPGSQATTSTGLNYLLGEDNDNTRVPFKDGLMAEKNPTKILEEKILEKITSNQPKEKDKQTEMFKMVEEFQKFKKDNPNSRMSFFMFREKKKKEKELFKNKIIELDLKYPDKQIIDKETQMINKENLKEAIDEAEANLEISPIDGLTLKRSINTEGEQSVTSGSLDLGNLNFSSDNIEEGKLTSKGNFDFGGMDLSGMVNSNDGEILNTELGFNYDNFLKGKRTESDGYKFTELDLNKTFPISDKFNLNLKGGADTQTFNGKTYRSSDLTPKLSYNDGILNASIAKEIMEGGDTPNLSAGVNFNDFYAKGDNLLSENRSGVLGYQKEMGDPDGSAFFTLGGEIDPFTGEKTAGAGFTYKFADGGVAGLRQGYVGGGGVNLARRGFLKILAGTGAAVAAFKTGALKLLGKSTTKAAPKLFTAAEGSGAPAWFEGMVNKVLADGVDITKKAATMDGQTVKSLDTPTGKVDVTIDRTGNIDVNYMGENTAMGEGVDMRYVVGQADEMTKVKPFDEFEAVETIPEGKMTGPDDYNVEFGENATGEVKNLFSDVSELQTLGGDKRLINDISVTLQKKKTLKQMNENPTEFANNNLPDYDPT